jgi:hypothetical protein
VLHHATTHVEQAQAASTDAQAHSQAQWKTWMDGKHEWMEWEQQQYTTPRQHQQQHQSKWKRDIGEETVRNNCSRHMTTARPTFVVRG